MSLPFISFEEYFDKCRLYERTALKGENTKTPKRINSLSDTFADIDVIILDSWGVLESADIGDAPAKAIAKAYEAGKELCVLSNDGNAGTEARIQKYANKGMAFKENQLVNGLEVLEKELENYPRIQEWGGVFNQSLSRDQADTFIPSLHNLSDPDANFDQMEGFILFTAGYIDEAVIDNIIKSLKNFERPLLVANPDIAAPNKEGMYITPGYHAQRIAKEAGINPIYLGKPFNNAYEYVLNKFPNTPRERILMVGDTLHTDILGGNNAGLKTLLVECGVYAGKNVEELCELTGIWPDYIAPHI